MKKMDEMDRNILLRSQAVGYRIILLALSLWTLYNCWQTLANGTEYHPIPGLILCFGVCAQSLIQVAMKQKMVSGDEEYKEPNRLLQGILTAVVIAVLLLSLGTYLMLHR